MLRTRWRNRHHRAMTHITLFDPVFLRSLQDRAYGEGEQAFISYGSKSNDELLQFYGFVERDCPADTYVVVRARILRE